MLDIPFPSRADSHLHATHDKLPENRKLPSISISECESDSDFDELEDWDPEMDEPDIFDQSKFTPVVMLRKN